MEPSLAEQRLDKCVMIAAAGRISIHRAYRSKEASLGEDWVSMLRGHKHRAWGRTLLFPERQLLAQRFFGRTATSANPGNMSAYEMF